MDKVVSSSVDAVALVVRADSPTSSKASLDVETWDTYGHLMGDEDRSRALRDRWRRKPTVGQTCPKALPQ